MPEIVPDRAGGQSGKLTGLDNVTEVGIGNVCLEDVLDRQGLFRRGVVNRQELVAFLVEQVFLGLEIGDQADDLFEHLTQGQPPVRGNGLSELVEIEEILGFVEDFLADVFLSLVPVARGNEFVDQGVILDGLGKAAEEFPVDPHAVGTDGGFVQHLERVGLEAFEFLAGNHRAGGASGGFVAAERGELEDFVVVVLLFEILAVGKEVKELEMLLGDGNGVVGAGRRFVFIGKGVFPRAASLDLDKILRREDRTHEAEVENVFAVVAGGHHSDGDANAGFGRLVTGEVGVEPAVAVEVVVGEGEGHLLGQVDTAGDLAGKVGIVPARPEVMRHLVQNGCDLGGVVLGHAEDEGLADLAGDGVLQGVLEEGLAENCVCLAGQEFTFEILVRVNLLDKLAVFVRHHHGIALIGKHLGGDLRAGIGDDGVHKESISHAVQQAVAVGGFTRGAAERFIGVQQQAAFDLSRIVCANIFDVLKVVFGCGGQAQLVADEIVEHRPAVAPDAAVGFVRDNQIKVGRREQLTVLVIEQKGLDGRDDNFSLSPVVAFLLVDDRLVVVFEVTGEGLVGLVLQFKPIHEEQDPPGIARAKEQPDHGGGNQRLARAGGHLEQEAAVAAFGRVLQPVDGPDLIFPHAFQAVVGKKSVTLRFILPAGIGGVIGFLYLEDIILGDILTDQVLGVGLELLVLQDGILRGEAGNDLGIAGLDIPEIVQVPVGKDYEPDVLAVGIGAGLFLGVQGVDLGPLGFEYEQGEAFVVQQEEIHVPG